MQDQNTDNTKNASTESAAAPVSTGKAEPEAQAGTARSDQQTVPAKPEAGKAESPVAKPGTPETKPAVTAGAEPEPAKPEAGKIEPPAAKPATPEPRPAAPAPVRAGAKPREAEPAPPKPPAGPAAPAPQPPGSSGGGKGLAIFALLIALAAAGGSGYLWYLWDQERRAQADEASVLDARIKSALSPREADLQSLKQQFTAHKSVTEQLQSSAQSLQSDLATLQSEFQVVKEGLAAQEGDAQVWKQQLQALQTQVKAHNDQIARQQSQQASALQLLTTRADNMQLAQSSLLNSLDEMKLIAARGGDVNALPLAEVEYLLRIADHKLKFQQDVPAAITALTAAQTRLQAIGEKDFAPVAQMIAENIASLRGVKLPDRPALARKIIDMGRQVDSLPLRQDLQLADLKARVKPKVGDAEAAAQAEGAWWERASAAAWAQLKDIVVIRHERSTAPPLMAMEEKFFLRQNLRLELEAMRAALMMGDGANYQESDNIARDWVETYFNAEDPGVAAFLTELQSLQALQFNPYIPDLSGTLRAFHEVMERRAPVRSALPAPAAPAKEAQQ